MPQFFFVLAIFKQPVFTAVSLRTIVGRIFERFVSTGYVRKGKSTGRPIVATPDVQNVEEIVEENRHISIRPNK
jgi:hypothetical protein